MTDLKSKLRGLDRLEAPDLWERSSALEPTGPDPDSSGKPGGRRLTAAVVAIAVFVAAGVFAWTAFRPDETPGMIPVSPGLVDGTILWPERTASALDAVQLQADGGDPSVAWRLDPKEVATRFAETVLGWGTPDGRYSVENTLDDSPPGPGVVELQLTRIPVPCAPSTPGPGPSNCPPPYEGELLTLAQEGTVGAGGIWSVTRVKATNIKLDLAAGDQLADGSEIQGSLEMPFTDPPTDARAGVVIGTQGDCFIGASRPEDGSFKLSVRLPEGTTCDPQPSYAWAATERSGELVGLTDPAPLSAADGSRTIYALTALPFSAVSHLIDTGSRAPGSTSSPGTSSAAEPASNEALTSSVVLAQGSIRCTAVFHDGSVDPGSQVGVTFEETNTSGAPVDVAIGDNGAAGWLLISSAGQQVSDTSLDHSGVVGPPPTQKSVPPGDSVSIEAMDTPVLWPGPLDVTPVCEGQEMPPVRLDTATTQAPGSSTEAVDKAVADTDGFFANCRPKADGSWSKGSVPVGGGSTLNTRCGAWVQENPGFDVVVLAAVAPPNAPELDLSTLPAAIQAVPMTVVPQGMGVRWWIYVVTDTEAQHAGGHTVVVCANSMSYGSGLSNCGH